MTTGAAALNRPRIIRAAPLTPRRTAMIPRIISKLIIRANVSRPPPSPPAPATAGTIAATIGRMTAGMIDATIGRMTAETIDATTEGITTGMIDAMIAETIAGMIDAMTAAMIAGTTAATTGETFPVSGATTAAPADCSTAYSPALAASSLTICC